MCWLICLSSRNQQECPSRNCHVPPAGTCAHTWMHRLRFNRAAPLKILWSFRGPGSPLTLKLHPSLIMHRTRWHLEPLNRKQWHGMMNMKQIKVFYLFFLATKRCWIAWWWWPPFNKTWPCTQSLLLESFDFIPYSSNWVEGIYTGGDLLQIVKPGNSSWPPVCCVLWLF